jgi:SH2 domain
MFSMYLQDGAFMIRESKRGGASFPYALSVYFKRTVSHLLIRLKPNGKFALGVEKPDEKV